MRTLMALIGACALVVLVACSAQQEQAAQKTENTLNTGLQTAAEVIEVVDPNSEAATEAATVAKDAAAATKVIQAIPIAAPQATTVKVVGAVPAVLAPKTAPAK